MTAARALFLTSRAVAMLKGYKHTKPRVVSHIADEPSRADLAARLAERDARIDADTRTEAERWLNDPPRWRSALASRKTA
jgi:hypothetical protein